MAPAAASAVVIPPNADQKTVLGMVASKAIDLETAAKWLADNATASRFDNTKPLFRRTAKDRVWFQLGRGKGKQTSATLEFESLRMFAKAVQDSDPSVAPFLNGGTIKDIQLSKSAQEE